MITIPLWGDYHMARVGQDGRTGVTDDPNTTAIHSQQEAAE
jgi:hypothetical protein